MSGARRGVFPATTAGVVHSRPHPVSPNGEGNGLRSRPVQVRLLPRGRASRRTTTSPLTALAQLTAAPRSERGRSGSSPGAVRRTGRPRSTAASAAENGSRRQRPGALRMHRDRARPACTAVSQPRPRSIRGSQGRQLLARLFPSKYQLRMEDRPVDRLLAVVAREVGGSTGVRWSSEVAGARLIALRLWAVADPGAPVVVDTHSAEMLHLRFPGGHWLADDVDDGTDAAPALARQLRRALAYLEGRCAEDVVTRRGRIVKRTLRFPDGSIATLRLPVWRRLPDPAERRSGGVRARRRTQPAGVTVAARSR